MVRPNIKYACRLMTSERVRDYIHGGKGLLKLSSPTGKSHCYLFLKPHDSTYPDEIKFVYAVHFTDPEHYKLFYVGMLDSDRFRLTSHSKFTADTEIVKGANYIVRMAYDEKLFWTSPMVLAHLGTCAKCGRALTDAVSMKYGFGKRCRKKMQDAKEG